ncbi:MAG: SAM-dependent methyltransferase, partial [Polyangia bacterium]
VELHNPWIRENRFRGRFFLWDLDGRRLPFPPTNFLIVGEKVAPGRGVAFSLHRGAPRPPRFLRRELFADPATGQRFELCSRPNPVVDLVPYFQKDGRLFVLGKQGFPRPLVNAAPDSPNLDAATVAGYLTEPLSAQRPAAATELTLDEAAAILGERAGLAPGCIAAMHPGLRYFTSPGGLNERVTASLIELRIDDGGELPLPDEAPNYSGFAAAGRVRPLDARQLLRAAQVGGLLDARLELNTHHLLRARGEPLGPWIGAEIGLSEQPTRPGLRSAAALDELLRPPSVARFVPCPPEPEARFLEVFTVEIHEHDSAGQVLARSELEVVAPKPVSCSTVSLLPVVRAGGVDYVGLELRDLPAVQAATGSSRILTCPAWRLPRSVLDLEQAEAHALRCLAEQFAAQARRAWPLGGKYYPAAGATPEVVYPLAAEIDVESVPGSGLHWLPLAALVAGRAQIRDGHLLIALLRLSHALEPVG